jgi:acetyl esterase/lipase
MDIDRRALMAGGLVAGAIAVQAGKAVAQAPQKIAPPEDSIAFDASRAGLAWPKPARTIALWDKPSPGALKPDMREVAEQESTDPTRHFRWVNGISRPRMCIFPAEKPNGGGMLIIPGGGFVRNYFDHEGYLLADYFAKQGVTSAVLFYRLAQDGWDRPADVGIIDAQRAMRVFRALAKARDLPVDPKRIGVIGFSAGGFLAASLQTRYDHLLEPPVDAIDKINARPMLAAPIYPVQSLEPPFAYKDAARVLFGNALTPELARKYAPEHNVTAKSPPGFFVHCADDGAVSQANSTRLADALTAKGVASEVHLFPTGGHGFGYVQNRTKPVEIWPQLFINFAQSQDLTG